MVVKVDLTAAELQMLGLQNVGVSYAKQQKRSASRNYNDFRSVFGACPKTCEAILRDIQTTTIPEARIDKPDPDYFLMSFYWLRVYDIEVGNGLRWKIHPDTFRKHAWKYVGAMAGLKGLKIVWRYDDGHDEEIYIISVDGTHCRINEPRTQPSATWNSPKLNKPGLSYEIAISVVTSEVVWLNGPFPAGVHDLTIWKKPGGLKSKMPAGKKAIADKGYIGKRGGKDNQPMLAVSNEYDSPAVRRFKRMARARHENFNCRMKVFKVLENRFRHGVEKHKGVFEAVAVICQYDMENGHPLMDAHVDVDSDDDEAV